MTLDKLMNVVEDVLWIGIYGFNHGDQLLEPFYLQMAPKEEGMMFWALKEFASIGCPNT